MIRYKTFKTGFRDAVLNDDPDRIHRLTQRMGDIHKLRTLAHQFAKYCTLRAYENNTKAPSVFGKNKENGWTAYYSAIAQPQAKITQGHMRQWYTEFSVDMNINKGDFKNLADQYNSHTAGQSVSLCKRHVSQEYKKHISHFVRVHFCDEIKKRETKDERKILWSCIDTMSDALINGSISKENLNHLQALSINHGLLFKTFLDIHLASGMFKAFANAEQRDEMIAQLDEDDDDMSVRATVEEYEQWHKAMWYMNTKIETLNLNRSSEHQLRVRCLIPLINGIYPKHAQLYAKPLIQMLGDNYKIRKESDQGIHGVWSTILKTKILDGPKSFVARESDGSKTRYRFAQQITTDGYSGLSLLFVHPHDFNRHVGRATQMGEARQITKRMTPEELAKYKAEKEAEQKIQKKASRLKKKEYEKEKRKAKKDGIKPTKAGIPYFDTLDPNVVQKKRHIYIDSGHYGHDMIDKNFRCDDADRKSHKMVAEQRHRLHCIGTKRKAQLRCAREKRCRLDASQCDERKRLDEETKYANNSTRFLNYCKALRQYAIVVSRNDPEYNSWHSYQGLRMYGLRNRYESNLMTSISSKFGRQRDTLVIIGDYSATYRPSMRGTVPAFVVGMGRLLKRSGYSVAWIDEYNTSKLYHKTHREGEQAEVIVKRPVDVNDKEVYRRRWERGKGRKQLIIPEHAMVKEKSQKLHAVKLFKTECGMKAFCNRDTNAVLNFKYIVDYWLAHGTRPKEYCRGNVNTVYSPEPMIANA